MTNETYTMIKNACEEFMSKKTFSQAHKYHTPRFDLSMEGMRILGIQPSEDVFLYYDASVFGNGKSGFAITNKGFYCRSPFSPTYFTPYDELYHATFSIKRSGTKLYAIFEYDQRELAYFPGLSDMRKDWMQLYQQIQEIYIGASDVGSDKNFAMMTTHRGKEWELSNSFWTLWSLTLVFSFIGFFWIGIRSRAPKWIVFGMLYFLVNTVLSSVLLLSFIGITAQLSPILVPAAMGVIGAGWLSSLIQSFVVRKEYLIRREAVLDANTARLETMRNEIRGKYIPNTVVSAPQLSDYSQTAVGQCRHAIANYLHENESTPFFRERLTSISERLDAFEIRYDNIYELITKRFGSAGLSYSKFAAPLVEMQDYVIQLCNNLMSRMQLFNEEEYMRRIDEFKRANRTTEAAGYKEIRQEYRDYADQTLAELDNAILRLDRLGLEFSKLRDSDVEKAVKVMDEFDANIQHAPLYK